MAENQKNVHDNDWIEKKIRAGLNMLRSNSLIHLSHFIMIGTRNTSMGDFRKFSPIKDMYIVQIN